jgi:hypothetical protein
MSGGEPARLAATGSDKKMKNNLKKAFRRLHTSQNCQLGIAILLGLLFVGSLAIKAPGVTDQKPADQKPMPLIDDRPENNAKPVP